MTDNSKYGKMYVLEKKKGFKVYILSCSGGRLPYESLHVSTMMIESYWDQKSNSRGCSDAIDQAEWQIKTLIKHIKDLILFHAACIPDLPMTLSQSKCQISSPATHMSSPSLKVREHLQHVAHLGWKCFSPAWTIRGIQMRVIRQVVD